LIIVQHTKLDKSEFVRASLMQVRHFRAS